MVVRIDGLADVVQKGRQQEFLVVGECIAGVVEDLEAVVEGVPLGMPLGILLHVFQRQEQALIDAEAVGLLRGLGDGRLDVEPWILDRHELLKLGDAGPLDRFARD